MRYKPAVTVTKNSRLCYSGARSQTVQCGRVVARSTEWTNDEDSYVRGGYWVAFEGPPLKKGDSGAPVWLAGSREAVGLISGRRNNGSESLVEPLLHPRHLKPDVVVGILHNKHLAPLTLKRGR